MAVALAVSVALFASERLCSWVARKGDAAAFAALALVWGLYGVGLHLWLWG